MKTQVLIIGGGATGTAIARDLAMRGIRSILVEKGDLSSGASGGNHGLLHSGGRYVSNDQEAAVECRVEGEIIKRCMPQCVEDTGGLFVAVKGDDEKYIADFPGWCGRSGIRCEGVDVKTAREWEPGLSPDVIAAYKVPDASVDPFKISLQNSYHAVSLGSRVMRRTEVVGFRIENQKIVRVEARSRDTGERLEIEAEHIVNASGAWAAQVAGFAGISLQMLYSKGTLLITNDRINQRVINRLRPPSDADIIVPGGTVSVLGTTSTSVEDPDTVYPTVGEVDRMIEEGGQLMPALFTARYIRAFCGVRPLVGGGGGSDGRSVSRGFALLDHEKDGVANFVTITGGKLTTFRLMAERTVDLVCQKLGNTNPCRTAAEPLPEPQGSEWTEPAFAPKKWMGRADKKKLICECEMVSERALEEIATSLDKVHERPRLVDIGFRSRLGKGTCQGAFCGTRAIAHLYEKELLERSQGLTDLLEFFAERWKGIRPICFGDQLVQTELTEAIHFGIFSEELFGNKRE